MGPWLWCRLAVALLAVAVLAGLPWLFAGRWDALGVCDKVATLVIGAFFGTSTLVFEWHFYFPTVAAFACTAVCSAVFCGAEASSAMRRMARLYYAAAMVTNLYKGMQPFMMFCGGGLGMTPDVLLWMYYACVIASWSWQVGTTLLLHGIVIVKLQRQQHQTKWLERAVWCEALFVVVYTVDIMLLPLPEVVEDHAARAVVYYSIFLVADTVFTVITTSRLLRSLRTAERAHGDGSLSSEGREGRESEGREELGASIRVMRRDVGATILATWTGTAYYLIALTWQIYGIYRLNMQGTVLGWTGVWLVIAVYIANTFDSATNDFLVLVLFSSRALDDALVAVQRAAAEQRRLDAVQQEAFVRACGTLNVAPLPQPQLLELAQREARVRREAADGEWLSLRDTCEGEQGRVAGLMMRANETYGTLYGRYQHLLAVDSRDGGAAQQPASFSTVPEEAVEQLRRDGKALRQPFENQCGVLVAKFNAAQGVQDLGLDTSQFVLQLDQSRPLPLPPTTADSADYFPITGTSGGGGGAREARFSLRKCFGRRRTMPAIRAHLHAPMEVKKEKACLRKIEVDYAEAAEPARQVLDIVRVTVIFACPYHLTVFIALVEDHFHVVRTKNRFREPLAGSEYRDFLLNILFEHEGVRQVVEMQLSLEILMALKRFQHKPYGVLRHDTLENFRKADPVFYKDAANSDHGPTPDVVGASGEQALRYPVGNVVESISDPETLELHQPHASCIAREGAGDGMPSTGSAGPPPTAAGLKFKLIL